MSASNQLEHNDNWANYAAKTNLKHQPKNIKVERVTLLIFTLFNQQYALMLEGVKEIISVPEITPIPQTPDEILGVGSVRGVSYALMDLNRRILGEFYGTPKFVVVLKSEEYKLGLLVQEVPHTLQVDKAIIDFSNKALVALSNSDNFISGVFTYAEKKIFMIDVDKL